MSRFDYDKIKDMEYDKNRERYTGQDDSEFRVTPYSNGNGYKYDYYDRSTYGNTKHNSTHVESDLNENWNRTDNNRDDKTQEKSSGSGCYLTTACMKHYLEEFDDNCYELTVLRWFRDNYVSKEDIKTYYEKAPLIVEAIESEIHKDIIYDYIYNHVVKACVTAIEQKNYEFVYQRYKSSILSLEEKIAKPYLKIKETKDILFSDYPELVITNKSIEQIKKHPEFYVNTPVRVFMGKVYTTKEYEKRRKRVLETPLP